MARSAKYRCRPRLPLALENDLSSFKARGRFSRTLPGHRESDCLRYHHDLRLCIVTTVFFIDTLVPKLHMFRVDLEGRSLTRFSLFILNGEPVEILVSLDKLSKYDFDLHLLPLKRFNNVAHVTVQHLQPVIHPFGLARFNSKSREFDFHY